MGDLITIWSLSAEISNGSLQPAIVRGCARTRCTVEEQLFQAVEELRMEGADYS